MNDQSGVANDKFCFWKKRGKLFYAQEIYKKGVPSNSLAQEKCQKF